jgi:hypothetical protein
MLSSWLFPRAKKIGEDYIKRPLYHHAVGPSGPGKTSAAAYVINAADRSAAAKDLIGWRHSRGLSE